MENFVFKVDCERISKQARYRIFFSYNDQLFGRIKLLPSEQRRYNMDYRAWEITTKGLYTLIKMYRKSNKIQFNFGGDEGRVVFTEQLRKIDNEQREKERLLKELIVKKEHWIKLKEEYDINGSNYDKILHKNLKQGIKLFDYQKGGVLFLNEVRNALLSHEMGLGKTIQAITYVEMNNFEKVFVITPNSLKFNFYYEIKKFTNAKSHIIGWKKNKYSIEEAKYIIVNYEYFNSSNTKKMNIKFKKLNIDVIDCLICDESSRLKNTKSNTFKNFKRIFKEGIFRNKKISKVFLSGTPMPNRVQELYTVLNQISPIEFPTKRHFYEYYCGMGYDPAAYGGWTTEPDKAKLEELYNNIAPYTHRKKKRDVLKELPDKIFQKIILELDSKQQKLYDEIEEGIANEFINEESSNILTIMLRLRQYTSSLKTKTMVEVIDRLLDEGQKVVIVDYFKDSLGELKEYYKDKACLHTGDYTVEDRAEMVRDFQDPMGIAQIFLGSIQTCNYGLTLTAASRIFLLSLPYSVGEFDQVIDRLHRIGQKDVVNAYSLLFLNTIDEYIFYAIEGKRREINKVMDNEDYKSNVSESVMGDIMKMIENKYGKTDLL